MRWHRAAMEKARQITPFGLRLPEALRERLRKAAEIEGRSLNSEIVRRLESSFSEGSTVRRLTDIEAALRKSGLMNTKPKRKESP